MADLNAQTIQSLFGQASPYGAHLFGEQLRQQDAMRPIEQQTALAELAGKDVANRKAEQELKLAQATFQDDVTKAGLANILQEENILGKRKENAAKQFELDMKNILGPDFYADNERIAQAGKRVEHMTKTAETFGQLASQIENTPMLQRHSLLLQYADKLNLSQQQLAMLVDIPAEHMPQVLAEMSKRAALAAPEYTRQVALEELKHKHAMELANLKGNLDKQVQNLKGASEKEMKTFEAAIVRYRELASRLPPGPERDQAEQMASMYASELRAVQEAKAAPQYIEGKDSKGRSAPQYVGPTGPAAVRNPTPVAPGLAPQTPRTPAANAGKTPVADIMKEFGF